MVPGAIWPTMRPQLEAITGHTRMEHGGVFTDDCCLGPERLHWECHKPHGCCPKATLRHSTARMMAVVGSHDPLFTHIHDAIYESSMTHRAADQATQRMQVLELQLALLGRKVAAPENLLQRRNPGPLAQP